MDQGPGSFVPTIADLTDFGPDAVIPQRPGAPQQAAEGIDWNAVHQREGVKQEQEQRAREEHAAELEHLRHEYGAIETVSSKFVQGALDALLAPGALIGAGAESVGELLRNKTLTDFGRDLGEAASGRSAMEAFAAATGAITEGSLYKGADYGDYARERLEKQEEARPMLSTLSRMAGLSAFAVGLGGLAAGESKAAASIAANAAEGAAGGAQAAYEHEAPLRDVLSSTLVGGVLGGGIAGAGELVQAGLKRAPDLTKVFGEKVQDFADERAWKAVVDRDPQAMKDWMRWSPDRRARVTDRIRAADILGKGDEEMLEALNIGARDAGESLKAVATQLDDAGIMPAIGDMRERLAAQIGELRASGSGTLEATADAIEREVKPFMDKLAVKQTDDMGQELVVGYRNPSFSELRSFKQALGAAKSKHMRAQSLQAEEIRDLYGNVAQTLNSAADEAGPAAGRLWRESNEAATDFLTLRDALENQMKRKLTNRFVSPSDYGTSIGAGLATAIMSGNPVAGGLAAIGTAIGHKVLREGGSAMMSKLANRFARMTRHIPLATAGGPESQEVLQAIAKTKAFMDETAQRAGVNPTLQQAGRETARQVAAEQLAKKAGPFNPAAWHEKPLDPLQKVLYRTQILDAVSDDLAKAARATAELHPEIPAALDPRKLAKLTKDANGTEALGTLQGLVGESVAAAPTTPTGSAAGVALRNLARTLERADPAEAMARTHETANWLRSAQEYAQDDIYKEFALRTEQALRAELGQAHWGQAGVEYGKLVASPHEALDHLVDPAKLRDLLRRGEISEELTGGIQAARARVEAAHDAAFKLTGSPVDREIGKSLISINKLVETAEEALTLDGRPMARLFDAAKVSGVYEGVEGHIEQQVHANTVADHVEDGIGKIETVLKGSAAERKTANLAGSLSASHEITREEYDKRMKTLTQAVANPSWGNAPGVRAQVAPEATAKFAQLLQDTPKPAPSIHGKPLETLSQDDLRLANAMWEATTEPMSVLTDLAAGDLDPDKAAYAWKQYPGLQKAAQAGVVDVLMGLSDDERAEVPEHMLTQLDTALGFGGGLQDANEPSFAARMSKLYQPPPAPPKPGGMLESPAAEPSFTERLSGAM